MCPSRCGNPVTKVPRGLTLIELVVVLAILAVLAGVAVRSLEPIADQARYEATQQTLTNIEEAYLSRSVTNGSNISYSGFLADVGRLPESVGLLAERRLGELWENANGLSAYDIHNFDDPDTIEDERVSANPILVAAGWRGPYLLLPPGADNLLDGYDRPMISFDSSGDVIEAAGVPIASVVSRGANGVLNATDVGYQRDLPLPGGVWNNARSVGAVPVRVTAADGSLPAVSAAEPIFVRIYGPQNGAPARLAQIEFNDPALPELGGVLEDIVAGPRAIRAIRVSGMATNQTILDESPVRQLMVQPGMNSEIVLRLP